MKVSLPSAVSLIIPAAFLLLTFDTAAQTPNDLVKLNLHGRVKKITETDYRSPADTGLTAKKYARFFRTYEFNEKGQKSGEDLGIYEKSTNHIRYQYDDNDFLIGTETSSTRAGLISRTLIRNDARGRKSEQVTYDKNNTILGPRFNYKYDEKGNRTETWSGRPPASLQLSSTYTHDEKGNELSQTNYRPDGSSYISTTWTYNEKGNITEKISYKTDGKLLYRTTYSYDDNGNIVELNDFLANGTLSQRILFEYEFDPNGNWVKVKQGNGQKKEYTMERFIEYY